MRCPLMVVASFFIWGTQHLSAQRDHQRLEERSKPG